MSRHDPVNWSYIDDDDADIAYGLQRARARARIAAQAATVNPPPADHAFVGGISGFDDQAEVEDECHELQRKLVVNFAQVKNQVGWAKRRK